MGRIRHFVHPKTSPGDLESHYCLYVPSPFGSDTSLRELVSYSPPTRTTCTSEYLQELLGYGKECPDHQDPWGVSPLTDPGDKPSPFVPFELDSDEEADIAYEMGIAMELEAEASVMARDTSAEVVHKLVDDVCAMFNRKRNRSISVCGRVFTQNVI